MIIYRIVVEVLRWLEMLLPLVLAAGLILSPWLIAKLAAIRHKKRGT